MSQQQQWPATRGRCWRCLWDGYAGGLRSRDCSRAAWGQHIGTGERASGLTAVACLALATSGLLRLMQQEIIFDGEISERPQHGDVISIFQDYLNNERKTYRQFSGGKRLASSSQRHQRMFCWLPRLWLYKASGACALRIAQARPHQCTAAL